jgi:hypothetical protein
MAVGDQLPGYATGADRQDDELRRRNPQHANQGSNTGRQPRELKEKTKEKVRPFPVAQISSRLKRQIKLTVTQKPQSPLELLAEFEWIIAPLIFTCLAFFTRMYKIGLSPIVTWDEAQYVFQPQISILVVWLTDI